MLTAQWPQDHNAGKTSVATTAATQASSEPMLPCDLKRMPLTFKTGLPGPAKHILCYGDSLTAGYFNKGRSFEPYARALTEKLADIGMACRISFCGFSGRTAEEMVQTASGSLKDIVGLRGKGLIRTLEEDGPFDLVIIMAGTNDLGFGADHSQIIGWLQSLHAMCHERCVPTVSLAPPPAPCSGPAREVNRQHLAAKLKRALQVCRKGVERMATIIDPADHVPMENAKLWDPDGLHFSAAGSRTLGRGLAAVVVERLAPDATCISRPHQAQKLATPTMPWSTFGYGTPVRHAAPLCVIRRWPVYGGA